MTRRVTSRLQAITMRMVNVSNRMDSRTMEMSSSTVKSKNMVMRWPRAKTCSRILTRTTVRREPLITVSRTIRVSPCTEMRRDRNSTERNSFVSYQVTCWPTHSFF